MTAQRPDPNALIREAQALNRHARQLADHGANPVAARSADQFLQGAFDAYRSRDSDHLDKNVQALRLLVEELRSRASRT